VGHYTHRGQSPEVHGCNALLLGLSPRQNSSRRGMVLMPTPQEWDCTPTLRGVA